MEHKPIIIAEIGATHVGDISRAKMLIELASDAGANIVKFQKRNPIECIPIHLQNKPHPNPHFAWGNTYLEHRKNLEFTIQQHEELKKYCEDYGVEYSTSVWDMTSTKEVIDLNPKHIKIPSACNLNWSLIDYIYENFNEMIHISLGMTNKKERQSIILYILKNKLQSRTVVYHCTSIYPCPVEKLYLKEIESLSTILPLVGFSNHNPNIATDIPALAYGARYFERHFIDKRSFRHTDAQASLTRDDLIDMGRNLNDIWKGLQFKPAELVQEELKERDKLRQDDKKIY